MYGPKWPFLLMYGSHDMRQKGFPWVDELSTNPLVLGRHRLSNVPTSGSQCCDIGCSMSRHQRKVRRAKAPKAMS